jgi:hypothetical protein
MSERTSSCFSWWSPGLRAGLWDGRIYILAILEKQAHRRPQFWRRYYAAVIRRHDGGLVRAVARDVKRLVTNVGVDHFLPGARLGKWDGDIACAVGKIQQDHDELFGGLFRGRRVAVVGDDLRTLQGLLELIEGVAAAEGRTGAAQQSQTTVQPDERCTERVGSHFRPSPLQIQ